MSGWPWLGHGWAVHCHAGQFPPGRIVPVAWRFGRIPFVLLRPQALDMRRMPPLHWPVPTQGDTNRARIHALECGAPS